MTNKIIKNVYARDEIKKRLGATRIQSFNLINEDGLPISGYSTGNGFTILWQNNLRRNKTDKIDKKKTFVDDILHAVIERIKLYRGTSLNCEDNQSAIKHIYNAIKLLEK